MPHSKAFSILAVSVAATRAECSQQDVKVGRYIGFDLHEGMIQWCKQEISSRAANFEFHHHDIYNAGFNPDPEKPSVCQCRPKTTLPVLS
jgi:hypothetical protein